MFDGGTKKLDVSARFNLDRQAFSGTMSKFRVAREIKTGKVFGIKFLDEKEVAKFEARFKGLTKPTEGEIAMQIKHPRIVQTYEFGLTTTNQKYILMEYINGPGLSVMIQEKSSLLDGQRLNLFRQMSEAVEAVHEAGFIHRDICPRNFIVNQDAKWLKLIDFGLTVPDQTEFRQPGNRTGTPLYMAPEIVRRRATDKRLDIFALGVTAFRLFAFEHPWSSGVDTTGKVALAHDTNEPKQIDQIVSEIPPALAKTIMKAIAPQAVDRFDSVSAILRAIRMVEYDA